MKRLVLSAAVVIGSFQVMAGEIPEGTWKQTSSTAGDCSTCTVTISRPTPHIIKLTANNRWIGYAHYNPSSDNYTGAFEWEAGAGGAYSNVLFLMDLVYEGSTLTMNARSSKLNLSVTYREN